MRARLTIPKFVGADEAGFPPDDGTCVLSRRTSNKQTMMKQDPSLASSKGFFAASLSVRMRVLVCGQCACVRITENYIQCERVLEERDDDDDDAGSGGDEDGGDPGGAEEEGGVGDDDDEGVHGGGGGGGGGEDGGDAGGVEEEGGVGDDDDEGMGQSAASRAITNTPRRPPNELAACMFL